MLSQRQGPTDDMGRVLKPGGWVQMIELYWMCQSDNGSITSGHPLRQWSDKYFRSLEGIKDPRAPLRLQSLFSAAGLVEIEHRMIRLPLCGWSSGMCFLGDLLYWGCMMVVIVTVSVTEIKLIVG